MSTIHRLPASYTFDNDLSSYMTRIYALMAGGLLATGLTAWGSAHTPALLDVLYTRLDGIVAGLTATGWAVMFLPLILVMVMNWRLSSLSPLAMHILYWTYALLSGLSLSMIFMAFSDNAIGIACLVTAAMFGCLSLFGRFAKRDLTGLSSFLLASLVGLIAASAINLFLHSPAFQFFISAAAVVLFATLTAYDTQKLKDLYLEDGGEKGAIIGALTLYLDVINIFLNILLLTGKRK